MQKLKLIALGLSTALMATGCSNDTATPTPSMPSTAAEAPEPEPEEMPATNLSEFDGDWRLTALGDGEPLAQDRAPTISIDGDSVSGWAGCNRYTGGRNMDPTKPGLFGPMATTRMACPEPQMAIENAYLQALSGVTGARRDGDKLALAWETEAGSGELVFVPAPAEES